jgi:hypothetical protein
MWFTDISFVMPKSISIAASGYLGMPRPDV